MKLPNSLWAVAVFHYLPIILINIDFRGDAIKSFIDGSEVRHFPSKIRKNRIILSVASVCGLILTVIGIVVSIYVIRFTISGSVGASNAQLVASISNAVQIQVMNFIYSFIANALSENENHRTDTEVLNYQRMSLHMCDVIFNLPF